MVLFSSAFPARRSRPASMPIARRDTSNSRSSSVRAGRLWTIGTRGSPLAMAQAEEARAALSRALDDCGLDSRVEIRPIATEGDRIRDVPLRDIGGKDLFVSDIHKALLAGDIDFAAHSAKDLPGKLPPEVAVAAALPRRDPADALLSRQGLDLPSLPEGAVVGTCSPRREAQLRFRRPDLRVVPLRGNVGTRIASLDAPDGPDAILLAMAGLERLAKEETPKRRLDPGEWLPAVGQGILAITARADDMEALDVARRVGDAVAGHCLAAERSMLAKLGGDCFSPIAGLATMEQDSLYLRGEILTVDGGHCIEGGVEGPAEDAEILGRELGDYLRSQAGDGFWERSGP